MASQDNHHPLKFDSTTGEYYLPIPSPHSNLRLTPYRPDPDPDFQVLYLNDPRVYQNLCGPPFPYFREHAEAWNATAHARSQELFEALRRGDKYIDGCPLRAIREVQEDGSQILIGDFRVERESNDVPWLAEAEKDNETKPNGDPSVVWLLGYYLEPGHHRKGIMSLVVSTLIKTWMIPRMNCHRIAGTALIGNRASIKVFLNNGFVQQEDIPDWAPIPEGRGGGKMGLHVLRWSLKSEDGCTEASE